MAQLNELQKQQMKMAEELIFSGKRTVSFAKLFFYGIFDAERIFPFPEPSQEVQQRSKEFLAQLKTTLEKITTPMTLIETPAFRNRRSKHSATSA